MTPLLARFAQRVPIPRQALALLRAFRPTAATLTRQNTLDAYDSVYDSDRMLGEYLSPERLAFFDELASILAPLAPKSILDVGCGTGHLLGVLADRMDPGPTRIVGVDHSAAGIQRARALLPGATWLVDDLYSLSLKGEPFDLVLCTEVLEHLDEPERAVHVLRAHCAPGGRVVVTVPDGATDSWEDHVNFWDEAELRRFLEPLGLVSLDRIQGGDVLLAWLRPS
jgi:2-polyprenyl-3-methyl-5-hydroxy-6-metoxy-1,4-benzoquinol methylase